MRTDANHHNAAHNSPVSHKPHTAKAKGALWKGAAGQVPVRAATPAAPFLSFFQSGKAPQTGLLSRQAYSIQPLPLLSAPPGAGPHNVQFIYLQPGQALTLPDLRLHDASQIPGALPGTTGAQNVEFIHLAPGEALTLPGLSIYSAHNLADLFAPASTPPASRVDQEAAHQRRGRRTFSFRGGWERFKGFFKRDRAKAATAHDSQNKTRATQEKHSPAADKVAQPTGQPHAEVNIRERPLPSLPDEAAPTTPDVIEQDVTAELAASRHTDSASQHTYGNLGDLGLAARDSIYDSPRPQPLYGNLNNLNEPAEDPIYGNLHSPAAATPPPIENDHNNSDPAVPEAAEGASDTQSLEARRKSGLYTRVNKQQRERSLAASEATPPLAKGEEKPPLAATPAEESTTVIPGQDEDLAPSGSQPPAPSHNPAASPVYEAIDEGRLNTENIYETLEEAQQGAEMAAAPSQADETSTQAASPAANFERVALAHQQEAMKFVEQGRNFQDSLQQHARKLLGAQQAFRKQDRLEGSRLFKEATGEILGLQKQMDAMKSGLPEANQIAATLAAASLDENIDQPEWIDIFSASISAVEQHCEAARDHLLNCQRTKKDNLAKQMGALVRSASALSEQVS